MLAFSYAGMFALEIRLSRSRSTRGIARGDLFGCNCCPYSFNDFLRRSGVLINAHRGRRIRCRRGKRAVQLLTSGLAEQLHGIVGANSRSRENLEFRAIIPLPTLKLFNPFRHRWLAARCKHSCRVQCDQLLQHFFGRLNGVDCPMEDQLAVTDHGFHVSPKGRMQTIVGVQRTTDNAIGACL